MIMDNKLTLTQLNNVSEIEIVYKRKINCRISERPLIKSPADSFEILLHYWDENKIELLEEFKILLLNRANRVLQILTVSQGGITGTVADPRLILASALQVAACSIILAHYVKQIFM